MTCQSREQDKAIDLEKVRKWVVEAGYIALSRRRQLNVRLKADDTPVTSVDHEVESFLLDCISERYPHHQIMSEEGGIRTSGSDFVWVVDPIDGTRAFASGLPIWGISVGLLRCGEPYAGVFYMPAVGEMYWGDENGAFCNDISITRRAGLKFDDPLTFLAVPSNAHRLYEIDFPRVRSLGSTAAHLAYVARGAAIGALTRRVSIWDLAGILPLLGQTGVRLIYLSGAPFDVRSLIRGKPAPEPLIAAHYDVIDLVRSSVRVRGG